MMKNLFVMAGLLATLMFASAVYAYFVVSDRESAKLVDLARERDEISGRIDAAEDSTLSGDPIKGAYVATMGGCIACHTDQDNKGKPLAGGVSIKTPFGTFYSSNITSDTVAGIGGWSVDDFLKAMTLGVSPDAQHYYPAFPYTSYTKMSVQDLVNLKAWLDTVEPVASKVREHDIPWPVSMRSALVFWKAIYFKTVSFSNNNERGNYLVNGPGHCAECHSPRGLLGGLQSRALTGNKRGPDGESVPGIAGSDLSDWTIEDLELFLEVGITPSGDFTGGHMADVIEYGTGLLTGDDRASIANYLLSAENNP